LRDRNSTLLVLNKAQSLISNDFYIHLFKIPEVFSRLRNYRELLSQNQIHIPIWVYCLTQDIHTLRGTPQPEIVNFLISMGLYDRYISKIGWPDYVLGSGSLISVISQENNFENEALELTMNRKMPQEFSLIKIRSYYQKATKDFRLTNIHRELQSYSLTKIVKYLEKKRKLPIVTRFLCPHKEDVLQHMESMGLCPRDFVEYDEDLKWLWPIWKKTQIDQSLTTPRLSQP